MGCKVPDDNWTTEEWHHVLVFPCSTYIHVQNKCNHGCLGVTEIYRGPGRQLYNIEVDEAALLHSEATRAIQFLSAGW